MTALELLLKSTATAGSRASIGSVVAIGVVLVLSPMGDPIARFSYDLPFLFKKPVPQTNIVAIYADQSSLATLGKMSDGTLSYRAHSQLLERLARDGAKLVLYDFVFSKTNEAPGLSDELAKAMHRCSNIVLGATYDKIIANKTATEYIDGPTEQLRAAATNWGLVTFAPIDPDYGVRILSTEISHYPSIAWVGAKLLDAPVTRESKNRDPERWLNYYGPAVEGVFESRSFESVVVSDGVQEGFFKDKIVIVGGRSTVGTVGQLKDEFANPYTRFSYQNIGFRDSPGYEIHATALLNLLRGEWLTRMGSGWELMLVMIWGVGICLLFMLNRRGWALPLGLTIALAGTALCIWVQLHGLVWWAWVIPLWVQTFVAWFVLDWVNPLPIGPPAAFISYRRDGSSETARLIRAALQAKRIYAFLDVVDLGPGNFGERLLSEISSAPNFILVLSPGALDRCGDPCDWLAREIRHAISTGRNIVPIFKSGFTYPPDQVLGEEIKTVSGLQAVEYSHERFDAMMDVLAGYLVKRVRRKRTPDPSECKLPLKEF